MGEDTGSMFHQPSANLVDLFGEYPDIFLNTVNLEVGRIDLFGSLFGYTLERSVDPCQ